MSSRCFPLVGGRVMRYTALDACGRVAYGDCASIVSEGFVSIATTANVDDGEEISLVNANGKKCFRKPAKPTLDGYTHVITFCDVEPDMYAGMTGNEVVYDGHGVAVGFRVDTGVDVTENPFALEVWSNVPGAVCSDEGEEVSGYILHPYLQGGVLGDYTIENGAVSFQVQGIATMNASQWGVGPYDVVLDETGTPSPLLTPIGSGHVLHVQLTEVSPPEPGVDCGCIPLDDPASPAATSANAGQPGTFTPQPSHRPASLEEAIDDSLAAAPLTAWTAGQYVVLGDGSYAHWDGDEWLDGAAPA